jgi:Zn-dependent membrane protease YugP
MNYVTLQYESFLTWGLFILGIIVVTFAQSRINSAYGKYRRKANKLKISGVEVARKILDANGLDKVHVVEVSGELSDHYDPSSKVVRLSHDIFHGETIAAMAVAAHECGHAIQDKEAYKPMRVRSMLVPIVNLITYGGYIVSAISLLAGITGYLKVGILMIVATLIFQLVTLPVEFDASKRALINLEKLNLVDSREKEFTRDMLASAALTYVASFVNSVLNLLRLVIMYRDRD